MLDFLQLCSLTRSPTGRCRHPGLAGPADKPVDARSASCGLLQAPVTLESVVNFPFSFESSSVPSLQQVPMVFHRAAKEGDAGLLSWLPLGGAPAEGLPGAEGLWEAMSRSQGCVGKGGSKPCSTAGPRVLTTALPTARATMDDIFTQCREGNAVAVRLWLDNTENDLNQG